MENPFLKFHHFGLAVRRPREAEIYLRHLGYRVGEFVFDPAQNVRLAMCVHDMQPAVEIVSPGQGSGPIDAFVQRHASGIVYHLCYETSDLPSALRVLEEAGLNAICISPPQPAPLFAGQKVSFYNIIGIGLIEVLETVSPKT